ncbi:MAG: tetratricopeptide repeat protein [Chitinispirillales bacterium]|jgi:tetratricopeptide (TPR) repeat protein|nr:tetratricopeptide repeat protein [Chitinispirillales bacterium]
MLKIAKLYASVALLILMLSGAALSQESGGGSEAVSGVIAAQQTRNSGGSGSAEQYDRKNVIGIKLGLNFPSMSYSDNFLDAYKSSVYCNGAAEVFCEYSVRRFPSLWARPGMKIVTRGQHIEGSEFTYELDVGHLEINLPIALAFFKDVKSVYPYVICGPVIGFARSGDIYYMSSGGAESYAVEVSASNFSTYAIGLFLGAGIRYPFSVKKSSVILGIEAGYHLGLTNTYSDNELSGNAIAINKAIYEVSGSRKNRGFEGGVTFSFPFSTTKARRATILYNNLYTQACELYYKGKYYNAYRLFSQIAVEYPGFFRRDMVSYYQGACLEGMDMRQSAVIAFKRTKEKHEFSAAVPMAALGLMRVFYRSGDFTAVQSQFEELNTLGAPDSIKYHAYYIMGQTNMQRGDYGEALRFFAMIPDNHPDYVFGRHAAAVADAMTENYEGAIEDLELAIQIKPYNKAQEETVNRSYVFLGLLYYEDLSTEGALAMAVTALRKVPKNSYYYQDALLGLGWTGLKARQWDDCFSAGEELAKTATDPVLQSEGNLLQAYAQAMRKNYSQAVVILEEAGKRLSSYSGPSQAELAAGRNEYKSVRSEYEIVGIRLDELGRSRKFSVAQALMDNLQDSQSKGKASIDRHLKYEDEYKRSAFFGRNMEQTKEDIDFATAKFSMYAAAAGAKDASKKDGEAIDSEIEKLKKELEKAK